MPCSQSTKDEPDATSSGPLCRWGTASPGEWSKRPTPDCLTSAILAVHHHGLTYWDAMLWATARDAGCGLVISEDFQDGRTLGGVNFVNPFLERNDTLLRVALAPIP